MKKKTVKSTVKNGTVDPSKDIEFEVVYKKNDNNYFTIKYGERKRECFYNRQKPTFLAVWTN